VSGAKQAWNWVLAALVFLLALAAFLAYKLAKKDAEAKLALANATEANAQRDLKLKRERLAALKKDTVKNAAKIGQLESKIEAKKEKLVKKFTSQGLSGSEVAERFSRLRL
jgi:uncharacterized protein HemX